MKLKEVRIWPVSSSTALKAKADITFETESGELAVKGFRVVQTPGKEAFVAPPQEKYRDKSGKDVYKDLLWLSQSVQNIVYPKVLEAFKVKLASGIHDTVSQTLRTTSLPTA